MDTNLPWLVGAMVLKVVSGPLAVMLTYVTMQPPCAGWSDFGVADAYTRL
jgi:hypothetical protein